MGGGGGGGGGGAGAAAGTGAGAGAGVGVETTCGTVVRGADVVGVVRGADAVPDECPASCMKSSVTKIVPPAP